MTEISTGITVKAFSAQANVNAPAEIKFKEVQDPSRLAQISNVMSLFDKSLINAAAQLNQIPYNSAHFRIETADGETLFLRQCLGWRTKERTELITAMHLVHEFLAERGGKVPRYIAPSLSSNPYVTHAGHNWILSEWIDAPKRYSGSSPSELISLARAVGNMHSTLFALGQEKPAVIYPTILAGAQVNVGKGYDRIVSRAELESVFEAIASSTDSHITPELRNFAAKHKEAVLETHALATGKISSDFNLTEDGRAQLVHCDLIPQNILVADENRIVILDFEKMQTISIYADIGYATFCAVRQAAEQRTDKNLASLRESFLDAYFRSNDACPPENELIAALGINRVLQNFMVAWGGVLKPAPKGSRDGIAEAQFARLLQQLPGYTLAAAIEAKEIFA